MNRVSVLRFLQENGLYVGLVLSIGLILLGVFPVRNKNPYVALIPPQRVEGMQCRILSNPVRTSSGKYYRCRGAIESVEGMVNNTQIISSGKGVVTLYIPSQIVELYYPGKLYSRYGTADNHGKLFLVEQGARFYFSAFYAEPLDAPLSYTPPPTYYVTEARPLGFSPGFWGAVAYFRGLCRLEFKRLLYGWGEAGGLLLALLSGSGEYTDTVVRDNFRKAGLAHILALSGMHVAFVSGIILSLLGWSGKYLSQVLAVPAVVLFVWFAGFTPSLLRALICALLGVYFRISGTKVSMLKILCLSFFIHVVISSEDLLEISFMLSYLALAGILIIGPLAEPFFYRYFPALMASSFSASFGAQVLTAPVTLGTFGYLVPGGIPASLVVSPLISVFFTVGVVCIVLAMVFPILIPMLGVIVKLLYTFAVIPVNFFSKIPALEFL